MVVAYVTTEQHIQQIDTLWIALNTAPIPGLPHLGNT